MKSLLATLPLLLVCQLFIHGTGASLDVTEAPSLPDGYVAYPDIGSAYKVHVNAFTNWTSAEEFCVLEGAHLAVIDSEKKLEYALSPPIENRNGKRHVGIYRVDDHWVSIVDGRTLSSVPWAKNEPYYQSPFNCAMAAYGSNARIRSIGCRFHGDFVCEIPLSAAE